MSKRKGKWQEPLTKVLAIILAVAFVGAAIYKLVTYQSTIEQFARFGYDSWFVPVTILVELIAAGLVAVPATRYWGASLIIITMIGAMLSHLKADEPGEMIPPLVLMILATVITWIGPQPEPEKEKSVEEPAG